MYYIAYDVIADFLVVYVIMWLSYNTDKSEVEFIMVFLFEFVLDGFEYDEYLSVYDYLCNSGQVRASFR